MKRLYQILGAFGMAAVLLGSTAISTVFSKDQHVILGQVQKIDASANTVTVIGMAGKKEKQMIFHLTPQTRYTRNDRKAMLGDLKDGDKVTVSFTDEKGQSTAQRISFKNAGAEPVKLNK